MAGRKQAFHEQVAEQLIAQLRSGNDLGSRASLIVFCR